MSIFKRGAFHQTRSNPSEKRSTILIVDDEPDNLNMLKDLLADYYEVLSAGNGREALTTLEQRDSNRPIHVIITDQRMPEMDGVSFLEKSLAICPDAVRIILTGYSDIDVVINAINNVQVHRFLLKPFDNRILLQIIEVALTSVGLGKSNAALLSRVQDLNASLTEQVDTCTTELARARAQIDHKNRILDALVETSGLLNQAMEMEQLSELTLKQLKRVAPDAGFALFLRGRRESIIEHLGFVDIHPSEQAYLIRQQRYLLMEDGGQILEQAPALEEGAASDGVWRALPILGDEARVLGVLVIKFTGTQDVSLEIFNLFLQMIGAIFRNKLLARELERIADTDSLTGLYNRRYMEREIDRHISQAESFEGHHFAVLFVEMEGLKLINNKHGHKAGDQVIADVSRAVTDTCRVSDIVGRFSGNELILICPSTKGDEAGRLLERLTENCRGLVFEQEEPNGEVLHLPVLVSISCAASDECAPSLVLKIADQRMARVKRENPR